jgi:hypothetical protein
MFEPRHPNAEREFAVFRRSNAERRRVKVLTVSCRPDYLSAQADRHFRRWAFVLLGIADVFSPNKPSSNGVLFIQG